MSEAGAVQWQAIDKIVGRLFLTSHRCGVGIWK